MNDKASVEYHKKMMGVPKHFKVGPPAEIPRKKDSSDISREIKIVKHSNNYYLKFAKRWHDE